MPEKNALGQFETRSRHMGRQFCIQPSRKSPDRVMILNAFEVWLGDCLYAGVTRIAQALGEAIDPLFRTLPNESPRKSPF